MGAATTTTSRFTGGADAESMMFTRRELRFGTNPRRTRDGTGTRDHRKRHRTAPPEPPLVCYGWGAHVPLAVQTRLAEADAVGREAGVAAAGGAAVAEG
jgi:hypothetical protein